MKKLLMAVVMSGLVNVAYGQSAPDYTDATKWQNVPCDALSLQPTDTNYVLLHQDFMRVGSGYPSDSPYVTVVYREVRATEVKGTKNQADAIERFKPQPWLLLLYSYSEGDSISALVDLYVYGDNGWVAVQMEQPLRSENLNNFLRSNYIK